MISAKKIVGAVVGLTIPGLALSACAKPSEGVAGESWRDSIATSAVQQEGCFHASYPSLAWEQIDCTAAPAIAYLPRSAAAAAAVAGAGKSVGDGNDFAATASGTGLISQTVGTFPSVTGVTKETDGSKNDYSIQLNSNFMTTAVCKGIAKCLSWEQFVYSSSSESAFMQYWLIDYGTCPSGWMSGGGTDCYKNSSAVKVPKVTIQNLASLKMSGTAVAGGKDTLVFTTESDAYSVSGKDSVVDLATGWNASEFNIIGDGGGSEATFNTGSSVTVKIAVTNGSTDAPACSANGGTTAETNNMTLGSCQAEGGSTPYIEFTESFGIDAGGPAEDAGADAVAADAVSADAVGADAEQEAGQGQ